ncbi:hypothetical protein IP88_02570 [alpha proteobacterium AAP81b]|nr:hypothetical protein IP88_02570 [alpha proteobacterium AAP81b]
MTDILAATGLKAEAAAVARPGWRVLACGGHGKVLRAALEAAIAARRPDALVSIGLAGGLDPALQVGDVVVGSDVVAGNATGNWRCDPAIVVAPAARHGRVVGVALPAATPAEKAALHAATGALAVDMESHVVAAVAAAHGLPFAVVRVIGDTAATALPPAARVPLGKDGSVRLASVLAALARHPGQLPALLRLAGETRRAMAALAASRQWPVRG